MSTEKQAVIATLHNIQNQLFDLREALMDVRVSHFNAEQLRAISGQITEIELTLTELMDSDFWG